MSELNHRPLAPELNVQYGFNETANQLIAEQRLILLDAIKHHQDSFVSIDGPCPLTINPEQTEYEGRIKLDNASGLAGYISLDRECFYKPRTDPDAWHGVDESDSKDAYRVITDLARNNANVVAEIGSIEQLKRYGHALTMIWIGSRTTDKADSNDLISNIALYDPSVTIGIKNGMDGSSESALKQIALVNNLRGSDAAPAVLIYRGGENAQTPESSQEQYKRAHEATRGLLFYDTAHGTEMAYHPEGLFKKSVAGQILSSQALIHLTQQGFAPFGKLSEASDITAVMDPHMPLDMAMSDSRMIYAAKLTQKNNLAYA